MIERPCCAECEAWFDPNTYSMKHKSGCSQAVKTKRPAIAQSGSVSKPVANVDKKHIFIYNWRAIYPDLYRLNKLQPIGFDEPEYQFALDEGKGYKFDGTWLPQMVAVEMDGGNRMTRQGKDGKWYAVGRHTQKADYEKRNLATLLGWRVFYFTNEMQTDDPVACCEIVMVALLQKDR